MTCTRCGVELTLYVVNDRHCLACKRDEAARVRRDALRVIPDDAPPWRRRLRAKDMTPVPA